ncbi:hypothetical protein NDN08_002973 [Rhodosorus marinus]|uniref:NAD-dependent epimerase/dehydratase domain-containing protein n=1 Tax=Rhodosorus marinus TaxID=101924 RepID=A0AAV8UV86_9RHOD|nr:hypothetical protein NDN08_002973 [Rhodosorus marinus]
MIMSLHVVVGASGPSGVKLAKHLQGAGKSVRTVSRSQSVKGLDLPHISADATVESELLKACEGASVIYHCVGLKYSFQSWSEGFPKTVGNSITAAERNGATLVLADNLYCYDPEKVIDAKTVTTELPYATSDFNGKYKKSFLRAQLCRMLEDAEKAGRCKTAMVRASDFYGPGVTNSHLGSMFFSKLAKGKSASVVVRKNKLHSVTHIDDFAKALAIAGMNEKAWGKAWHVPNAPPAKFEDFPKLAGVENGATSEMPGFLKSVVSLFMPALREVMEMSYMFDTDFVVDSNFAEAFPEFGQPVSLETGLKDTLQWFKDTQV